MAIRSKPLLVQTATDKETIERRLAIAIGLSMTWTIGIGFTGSLFAGINGMRLGAIGCGFLVAFLGAAYFVDAFVEAA